MVQVHVRVNLLHDPRFGTIIQNVISFAFYCSLASHSIMNYIVKHRRPVYFLFSSREAMLAIAFSYCFPYSADRDSFLNKKMLTRGLVDMIWIVRRYLRCDLELFNQTHQ